jgi:NADH:ubiquinone oxidoreductase subunit F (NADH-binding)
MRKLLKKIFSKTFEYPTDIVKKIEDAHLVGRGGAGFPTHLKWKAVKKAKSKKKFVICNASEGEIGIFKDFHILKYWPEKVFRGCEIAANFLKTDEIYFNFNGNYYKKLKKKIDKCAKKSRKRGFKITIFHEMPSYPGGEETALCNAIEGKRLMPRAKPPFPSDAGLWGYPTMIHNVETLFNIAEVAEGKFENKRFYSISGVGIKDSVFHLSAELSAAEVLRKTENYPKFKFFAQIGGSASGMVFNSAQLEKTKVNGAGSIEIYRESITPKKVLMRWFEFYDRQSCGKCTPCREGTFQLHQLVKNSKTIPWKKISEILDVLSQTSFCALGRSVSIPVQSYAKNVLKKKI